MGRLLFERIRYYLTNFLLWFSQSLAGLKSWLLKMCHVIVQVPALVSHTAIPVAGIVCAHCCWPGLLRRWWLWGEIFWAGPVLVQLISHAFWRPQACQILHRMNGFKIELTIHVQVPVLESNNHWKCGHWSWGKKDDKAARPLRKPHCRSLGKMSTASGFALLYWAVHDVVVASRSLVIPTPFSRYNAW